MMQRLLKQDGKHGLRRDESIWPFAVGLFGVILASTLSLGAGVILPEDHRQECEGSALGLTDHFGGNTTKRHNWYRNHYENCTEVTSNLEIVHLNPRDGKLGNLNLSFLENIRQVHGYVLITLTMVEHVPLTSLRVIRGRTLFNPKLNEDDPAYEMSREGEGFSLYVGANSLGPNSETGLKELQFPSLREILVGNVLFRNNYQLCFDGRTTIDWTYIMRGLTSKTFYANGEAKVDSCAAKVCDPSCKMPHTTNVTLCWGPEPDMCQKVTKLNCDPSCSGRCYGPKYGECCKESACAGGCTSAAATDCWACRQYNNSGECVDQCPPYEYHDQKLQQVVKNPNVRYYYGTNCVKQCPVHMYTEKGSCVRSCAADHTATNISGVLRCTPCGGSCPKKCNGTNGDPGELWGFVNSHNIHNFINCTIVQGGLDITPLTFDRDYFLKTEPLQLEDLAVLRDIEIIEHYLSVTGNNLTFSLSFLRSLHTIRGQKLSPGDYSLKIGTTKLRSLGLVNLESITNGKIGITRNPELCYVSSIPWQRLSTSNPIINTNKDPASCTCSNRCNQTEGCWGPGDDECRSCLGFLRVDTRECLESCDEHSMLYTEYSRRQCRLCDVECLGGCHGEGPGNCTACAHARDARICVSECTSDQYLDQFGACQFCYANCKNGCTGNGTHLGYGGCSECADMLLMFDHTPNSATMCMDKDKQLCDVGYFSHRSRITIQQTADPKSKKPVSVQACQKCDESCEACVQYGSNCEVCKNYRQVETCVSVCGRNFYLDNETMSSEREKGVCLPCHKECDGCRGPTVVECIDCMKTKLFTKDLTPEQIANYSVTINDTYFCTTECPETLTYISEHGRVICVPNTSKLAQISVTLTVLVLVLAATAIAVVYLKRQLARTEERKLKIRAQLSGLALPEPEDLAPGKVKPDMSSLRLCKESELKRGQAIGSGAFGTVYKGVFLPERENVKIPVAIKELQEGSNPHSNNELLDEARVMATVIHPCCIRIMAVCFTKQLMLVTPLMPYGSLLDYLRRNQANIGSRILLTWCQQIADGMNYLESLGIVHRDLAARNVLVHSATQIKITDFGLAKMLADEESYLATGGKLPIKWLALECIQHRTFTHKSDVWAYGVTLWEMFTYGQQPYKNLRAIDMAVAIERGERLPQPTICTIDVYMLMVKCWMLDVDSRPTFAELSSEFSKMALDPARYIVIRDDELMRLPSVNPPDWKDLMRGMSNMSDGGEDFMNADDYLNPQEVSSSQVRHLAGIAEESYQNAAFIPANNFEDDDPKAALKGKSSRPSAYNRETSVRYIKDPFREEEQWPTEKPAPPPTGTKKPEPGPVASDMNNYDDGYLATNVVASAAAGGLSDDDGYLYVNNNASDNGVDKPRPPLTRQSDAYLEMTPKTPATPVANPEYYNPVSAVPRRTS